MITKTTTPYRPVRLLPSCLRVLPVFLLRCRCRSGCCACCVGAWAALTSTRLQLGPGPVRESMPVGLGARICPSLSLSSVRLRAFLPWHVSAASALRLRLCPAHLSRWCCWCLCGDRCFSGSCACAGAWVACASAQLQFNSRPMRRLVPVGLGALRVCLSLSLSSVHSRAFLPGHASAVSALRLRLCPAHSSRWCCWCLCGDRCFWGSCVCAGA